MMPATATGLEIDASGTPAVSEVDTSAWREEVDRIPATDSVRSYLTEIGRVPLLRRDEEVSEAKKVQRYMQLIAARERAVEAGDRVLQQLAHLLDLQRRLRARLNYRPSHERWASEAGMSVASLRDTLLEGKQQWAAAADTDPEELDAIERCGLAAKDRMLRANLRLVVSVAKKYQNRGLDLLDLIQEGTLGLERAVEKFDPTKGYRFSTYAYWWIRQGITRAIASQSRTIRIPVHITEKLNKIRKAQRQLLQSGNRNPGIEAIAKLSELEPEEVREMLGRLPKAISLEQKVGKDRDTELGDLIEADEGDTPEMQLTRELLSQDLRALLLELTDRERQVIELRYGLSAEKRPHSLAEVGRILEISRERVRQIEAKALHKLKQPKRRERVRDYLDAFN